VQLPELNRRAHVDKVDFAALGHLGKLLRADGRDDDGDQLSSFELLGFLSSFPLAGAELGPQLPLIQVFTPRRGRIHA
jgi:hypothetical protein